MGDEGSERCKGRKGHDSNSRVPVRCRDHWLEAEGGKGSYGGLDGRSSRSVEKGWLFQDCRCAQLEAEVKTCHTCAQGRQPFHERVGELMLRTLCGLCLESNLELFWSQWAVSLGH